MTRLHRADCFLLIVDVQERLVPVIDQSALLLQNIERLVLGARILGLPILVTEQYKRGLGTTVEVLRRALDAANVSPPIEKTTFSAWSATEFQTALRLLQRRHALVAGIEAHVCVFQTVRDLLGNGFAVTLADDAIASRTPRNQQIGIRRMLAEGATLSSTEMALFDLTRISGTDEFRAISRLLK